MGLGSGHLEIFVFRLLNKKKDSGIIGLVRPAGGTQNLFKTNLLLCKLDKEGFLKNECL